ncbi:MAG: type II secretion system minor pseudopilin GspK [Leptospirillia bacterium]
MHPVRPPQKHSWNPLANERGIALILTLLVVALLTVLIIEFDFRTRIDLRQTGNFRDDTQAYLLADSAVQATRALMVNTLGETNYYTPSVINDELLGFGQAGDNTIKLAFPGDQGQISVTLGDEDGKLDLNSLADTGESKESEKARQDVYYRLLEILEVEEPDVLMDSLIDWIDADPEELGYGAEGAYYLSLDPPYNVRNDKLRTFGELRLVRGYNAEILALLEPHVTAVWEGEKATKKTVGGSKYKININTASVELLRAMHEDISENLAQNIAEARPYEKVTAAELERQALLLGTEIPQKISPLLRVDSEHFLLYAEGLVGVADSLDSVRRTVRATLRYNRTASTPKEKVRVTSWRVE